MALFLLPWSGKHSNMDLVKKDLFEVWKEEGNRFDLLNPVREDLIRSFQVQTSPLAPVWRRYKGRFWEELSFWALPSRVQREIEEKAIVPSPLFGILGAGDLIPKYDLDWKTKFKGKTLQSFWKDRLEDLLPKIMDNEILFDFLSSEDRKVFTFPEGIKRVLFEYYRKDKRVINTLPHRAYTLRYIVEMGVNLEDLHRINFLDYKVEEIKEEGSITRVLMRSEGKYI